MPQKKRHPEKPSSPPTQWGPVADWYDQLVGEAGSEYHQHVIIPGVLRMLELQAEQQSVIAPPAGSSAEDAQGRGTARLRILDVACGQGVLCRVLHKVGAEVTGVDASAELLRLARERSDPAIQYVLSDARDLSRLSEGQYSAAICVLAIQNIHPLSPLLAGIARCLTPAGRLVIVMMHPCFRGPKYTAWGWTQSQTVQYRRVDRYLIPRKEPIVTHPGSDPKHYTWSFHRPLQTYVKALRNAGLLVDSLEEWPSHKTSQAGPRAAAENLGRKEIPMFLALRAVKVGVQVGVQKEEEEEQGADE
jgi:ubiquinone/menaquinone biosynthesis C-methylase UbiE